MKILSNILQSKQIDHNFWDKLQAWGTKITRLRGGSALWPHQTLLKHWSVLPMRIISGCLLGFPITCLDEEKGFETSGWMLALLPQASRPGHFQG